MQSKDIDWYDRCIKLLSFRPRSVSEIKEYLARKKVASADIQEIISRLLDEKFLDDHEFAVWWIEQRLTFRPKAPRIIAYELKQKGISQNVISEVLHISSGQELDMVIELAEKKWRILSRYPLLERKEKVLGYLFRRGFSLDVAKKALSSVVDGSHEKG